MLAPTANASPIATLELPALSPLLTLLDALIGHRTPLVSPSEVSDADADAVVDIANESATFGRFLSATHRSLNATLDSLSLCLATRTLRGDRGPLTCMLLIDLNKGRAVTRGRVLEYVREVEARLGQPPVVLEKLQAVAERVMHRCIDFVAQHAEFIDTSRLRGCAVRPGAFFGEDWSVGVETCWQASGAEGILTMPNYAKWSDAHKQRRASGYRGVTSGVCDGRLWRFEYLQCLCTPCHEVCHLIQHFHGQRMSLQVAEHDGAFSTLVLMLALAAGAEGAHDGLGACFFPGAAEETMLEWSEFASRVSAGEALAEHHTPATQAAYERWRDSFGVAELVDVWGSQRNFGGELGVESVCKNLLALEATAPRGQVVEGEAAVATARAMLATMFEGRSGECDGVPVDVRSAVQLAGTPSAARIGGVCAPMGAEAAAALLRALLSGR